MSLTHTGERWTHEGLLLEAEAGVRSLYVSWKEDGKIEPFFLAWPSETVPSYEGYPINEVCKLELPPEKERWSSLFHQALEITKAYAVLLCEQKENEVKVILESPHGACSWSLPVERHGDVTILGKAEKKTDVESLGLLWRPKRGEA